MTSSRSIGREIGTAFAVLAIYLLTVLAPLHHARASQLGFEQLGYATIESSWVLCTAAGVAGGDRDQSTVTRRRPRRRVSDLATSPCTARLRIPS